ncbi:hypothetical protein MOW14_14635 (plasmid) [Acinetobacter indicus]|uniref:hypothetical protein n=1 Tax=Acinetobacter indicus TaxID=756892 RepID=UPI001FA794D1|nr:hypothetical protein [Acinetobacter indicus]UNW11137.1 hypothetical protein MOW14_14635 [Acinetobacter indicus]
MTINSTRKFGIRLDNNIANEYVAMAEARGISPSTLMRELLTNNLHLSLFKFEIYKLEKILDEHSKTIVEATDKISVTEQMQRDMARMYLMMLWLIRNQGSTRENLEDLQQRAEVYYQKNYKKDN